MSGYLLQEPPVSTRRGVVFAILSAVAGGASYALKPRRRAAEELVKVDLERQVPSAFAGWSIDKSMIPVLPNPEVQAKLDEIYTQVIARTYVHAGGQRVMLSVAYGSDQGSDATSVHRPEFCYSAQGFSVRGAGEARLTVNGNALAVRRVVGSLGSRIEPITYWVTMNDRALLPGFDRKMTQIWLGLQGQIPDGMLVRVSTIGPAIADGFLLQQQFLTDLHRGMATDVRGRYFGADRRA